MAGLVGLDEFSSDVDKSTGKRRVSGSVSKTPSQPGWGL